MTKYIAFLDCAVGFTGDMLLGSMLDVGYALDDLQNVLARLPLQGYQLRVKALQDKGIQGSRFDVVLPGSLPASSYHLPELLSMIAALQLSATVTAKLREIFMRLTDARAHVSGVDQAEVTYSSSEAIRTLIVCVGVVVGLEALGVARLYASSLPLTKGFIETPQGLLPVPSPVTLELLRRVEAPWQASKFEGELVTSTGAALLAALAHFEIPPMSIKRVGYGFGWKRLPGPHCLRFCLGELREEPIVYNEDVAETDWVAVLETNIDNMTGELLGSLMERLLGLGALDVSYSPLQMKKNRPASLITVICKPEDDEQFAHILLRETTTLGVRIQHVRRLKAQREQVRINSPLGPMLVKTKRLGDHVISTSPEYEECLRLAKEHNMPLMDVYEVARQAIKDAIL